MKVPIPNKPGKTNWVEDAGGLPPYIRRIAEHLKGKGFDTGHAVATAVNTCRKIIAAKDTNPKSRAEAVKALATWEKMKAGTKLSEAPLTSTEAAVLREWAQTLDRDASTLLAALTSRAAPTVKLHAARAAARLVEGHVERKRNDRGYLTAALRSEVAFAAALREAADPMPGSLHTSATGKCTSPKLLRDGHDGGRECEVVREAQKGLLGKGFDVGGKGADGVYGPKTARGVRRMQRSYGLKADGVLGRFTSNAMNGGLMEARQADGDRDLLLLGEALHEVADTGLPMAERLAARHRADALHAQLSEAGFDHLSKSERSALAKLAVKNAKRDREGEFASQGLGGMNVKGRGGKSVGKIAAPKPAAKPVKSRVYEAPKASKKLPWAVTSTDGSRVETARFATKAEADQHAASGPKFAGFAADFAAKKDSFKSKGPAQKVGAPPKSKAQQKVEADKVAAVDLGGDSEKPGKVAADKQATAASQAAKAKAASKALQSRMNAATDPAEKNALMKQLAQAKKDLVAAESADFNEKSAAKSKGPSRAADPKVAAAEDSATHAAKVAADNAAAKAAGAPKSKLAAATGASPKPSPKATADAAIAKSRAGSAPPEMTKTGSQAYDVGDVGSVKRSGGMWHAFDKSGKKVGSQKVRADAAGLLAGGSKEGSASEKGKLAKGEALYAPALDKQLRSIYKKAGQGGDLTPAETALIAENRPPDTTANDVAAATNAYNKHGAKSLSFDKALLAHVEAKKGQGAGKGDAAPQGGGKASMGGGKEDLGVSAETKAKAKARNAKFEDAMANLSGTEPHVSAKKPSPTPAGEGDFSIQPEGTPVEITGKKDGNTTTIKGKYMGIVTDHFGRKVHKVDTGNGNTASMDTDMAKGSGNIHIEPTGPAGAAEDAPKLDVYDVKVGQVLVAPSGQKYTVKSTSGGKIKAQGGGMKGLMDVTSGVKGSPGWKIEGKGGGPGKA